MTAGRRVLVMYRQYKHIILRKLGGSRRCSVCCIIVAIFLTIYFYKSSRFSQTTGSRHVWDVDFLPENAAGSKCGVICPPGQVSFSVTTGFEMKTGPTICFNGNIEVSPEKQNTGRGINAIFVNPDTLEVVDRQTFDTYSDEYPFLKYMRENVPDKTLVIFASFDEISQSLKESGFKMMKRLGSAVISEVKFRDSYLLIGQMGLTVGHAIEFHEGTKTNIFGEPIKKMGCFSVPMGPFGSLFDDDSSHVTQTELKIGPTMKDCGVASGCDSESVPVMVFTGEMDKSGARICVGSNIVDAFLADEIRDEIRDLTMIIDKDLNYAGRGFNVVVLDSMTLTPKAVSRFDTYISDSLQMELFLEKIKTGDIVVAVVCDDASRKLRTNTKELLNKLGSSMVQNLKFRDVWYFVGQKGINGFTPYEQISYAGYDGDWPKTIHKSLCVPKHITGLKTAPNPGAYRNEARRDFCKKYDGYAEFCDAAAVDEPIKAVGLMDKTQADNEIFSVPIIVIPGMNHNALVRTLETIIMQPGVRPSMVTVTFDVKFEEHADLASLFGFKNYSLSNSLSYPEQFKKAITESWNMLPDTTKYIIVLEEEVILAPDFLFFMSQCLPILHKDPSLHAVSAWNPNGYDTTSGNKTLIYRVEEFPGLTFLLKKETYTKHMQNRMDECCMKRAWDGWMIDSKNKGEILLPDVSRVYRQPYQTSNPEQEHWVELFHRPRLTNLEGNVEVVGLADVAQKEYEILIWQQLKQSTTLPVDLLQQCANDRDFQLKIPRDFPNVVSVYYEQSSLEDYTLLGKLCKCFGLYSVAGRPPRNLYKGVIRFYFQKREILLIGSATLYHKYKPSEAPVLAKKSIRGV